MNLDMEIEDDETLDGFRGLRIIQKRMGYRYTEDAIRLAGFARVHRGDSVIDMGTGSGIIALAIAQSGVVEKITGLEIQPDVAEVARRNVQLNNFSDRISVVEGDIRLVKSLFKPASFDAAITNPPYLESRGGYAQLKSERAVSRHEILCEMGDVLEAMRYLLKSRGRGACIYPAWRFAEVISEALKRRLQPSRARFIHPSRESRAELLMCEFVKEGRGKFEILPPLFSKEIPSY
ncbi:MAG: tRNA1(Val) (adenine(37)-N6)-methyltransferase [Deltaproteobacteria bacterium]